MPLDQPVFLASGRTLVRGACPHDCPDTCALHVTVENGRAVKIEGDPEHPTTNGVLCTKVARYLERTYSDARVLHPLQRVGKKGEGKFRRISWDAALDTIATRFSEIAASPDGPEAIVPYSYAGTMGLLQYGSMDRRFFTSSAHRCSIARSARLPARRAMSRPSAPPSASIWRSSRTPD